MKKSKEVKPDSKKGRSLLISVEKINKLRSRDNQQSSDGGETGRSDLND